MFSRWGGDKISRDEQRCSEFKTPSYAGTLKVLEHVSMSLWLRDWRSLCTIL